MRRIDPRKNVSKACRGLLLALSAGVASTVQAALPTPYGQGQIAHKVVIPKLDTTVQPGTDLDQPPWNLAAKLTGNLDWRRIRTADLSVWSYLFYDDEALWLGYRCEVTPGPQLRAETRDRDENPRRDDHVTFSIDVGPTRRAYYRFMTNPLGTLYDSFIIDTSYNSDATVQTAVDERGWTAVIRVPFKDLPGRNPPAPGTTWSFNVATRTGFDNSWAPVLGGYHTPEEFSLLVFGPPEVRPVRLDAFRPLHVGPNAIHLHTPPETHYQWEAVDADARILDRGQGALSGTQALNLELTTDRIVHVNFAFHDADGRTLLTFWRPMDTRPLLHELTGLRATAQRVRRSLERYPDAAREMTRATLRDLSRFLATPLPEQGADWEPKADEARALRRRLNDASLYAQTLEKLAHDADFALALARPTEKVMIRDWPHRDWLDDRYELALARNEREAMQVVVIPYHKDLTNVEVAVSPLRSTQDGAPMAGSATVSLVGHVETRPAGSYLPEYVGWYPDPILHFQQRCDAAAGEHVAFWVEVATTTATSPGTYEGRITISADDATTLTLPLHVRVWDFDLPDGTHLRNAFTYSEPYTKKLYKDRWTPELARKYHDFILDHRLNIDALYGKDERDVELLKHGIARGMNAFNLFYVGRGADVDRIRELLQERMSQLEEAGIEEQAYIYGFDEVNDDSFPKVREIFGMVGELYPNLPRMTTGYDITFGQTTGLRDSIDIWVPLIPRYDMVEAEKLRAEGKEMWWYLCVGPRHPYPNFFVESPAIEPRLIMGAMSYKYQVGGVLYFMTNQWRLNDEPIASGPYTEWFPGSGKSRESVYANGDGSLFCPGPDGPLTTIRYTNIRDGLEDYEYLYKLASLVEMLRARPATVATRDFIERARALLAVPDGVVESSSRFTDDPDRLEAFRRRVANVVLEGQRLTR